MPGPRTRRVRVVALVVVCVGAIAIAASVIRPWVAAPLAYDTAASVLHFDRIVNGRHLEGALSTTPKPLLTLLYGLIYSISGDWRAISAAAVGAWGLSVAFGSALAWRLGGTVAALFVATGLMLSPRLLLEAAWGLGSVWALVLWFAAGLAVTTARPRWSLAGVALGLASLARLETFLVIGLALAVLAVLRFGPRRWRRPVPIHASRLAIGLLALPIMCIHDFLLTGNPLFWTSVASGYSAAAASIERLPSLLKVAEDLVALATQQAAMTLLGVVGAGVLAARGRWAIFLGLVALGPGTAVFLLVLAAGHVFVDERYLVPIEVTMIFAAGIGLGAIRVPELSSALGGRVLRLGGTALRARPAMRVAVVGLAAVVMAILCSPAIGPLDRSTRVKIASARHLARTADLALPGLKAALAESSASTPQLFVPVPVRPRLVVDLDRSLHQIMSYNDPWVWVGAPPKAGQMILLDVDPATSSVAADAFQLEIPGTVEGVRLVPLLSDPANGAWLLQVTEP